MPQMENACKLRAKCLKKDEPLDKCNNPECQNFIHPSCFNKLLVTWLLCTDVPTIMFLRMLCRDRASSTPLATMSSIGNLQILDEDGKEGKSDDNKPIEIDVSPPTFKRSAGYFPTLKKKPRASPSSLSSDVTELSLLKREQMDKNDNYRKMQFGLEQRKVELLEQEATAKMA